MVKRKIACRIFSVVPRALITVLANFAIIMKTTIRSQLAVSVILQYAICNMCSSECIECKKYVCDYCVEFISYISGEPNLHAGSCECCKFGKCLSAIRYKIGHYTIDQWNNFLESR